MDISKCTKDLLAEKQIQPMQLPRQVKKHLSDHIAALENMIKGVK